MYNSNKNGGLLQSQQQQPQQGLLRRVVPSLVQGMADTNRFYQQARMNTPQAATLNNIHLLRNVTPAGIAAQLPQLRAQEQAAQDKAASDRMMAQAQADSAKKGLLAAINKSGQFGGIGKDIIDTEQKIRKEYDFPFIFLTSNSDPLTVSEAKKVMPPAYLVKPFTRDELYSSIEIALYNYSKRVGEVNEEELIIKDAFFIKEKNIFTKLKFEDILFIKSEHVYAEIQLKNGQKHVIRGNLNKIITKLNKKFVRVHRSYIVNLDYLEQIDHNSIVIIETSIPIGKKYKDELLQKINLL